MNNPTLKDESYILEILFITGYCLLAGITVYYIPIVTLTDICLCTVVSLMSASMVVRCVRNIKLVRNINIMHKYLRETNDKPVG